MEKQPDRANQPLSRRFGYAALKGVLVIAGGFSRIGEGMVGIGRKMHTMAEGLDNMTRGLTGSYEERMDRGLSRLSDEEARFGQQVADLNKRAADFGQPRPAAGLDPDQLGLTYLTDGPPAPRPDDNPTPPSA